MGMIKTLLKCFSHYIVTMQILHLASGSKYASLPTRPLPLSLKPSEVSFDHVTLPYDVTVIAYHDVVESDAHLSSSRTGDNEDGYDVTLQNFIDQITYLEVNGYHTISVTELYAYLTGNTVLPPRSVLLTFEGARSGVWTFAYPVLREKKFHAAIFGHPENFAEGQTPGGLYMILEQLKVMDNELLFEVYPSGKPGMKLTVHNVTRNTLMDEMDGSRRLLEEQLGGSRPYFSWPQGAYNRTTLRFAKQFFNMSFSFNVLDYRQVDLLQQIPRFRPKGSYDLPSFLSALQEQQMDLENNKAPRDVPQCFDLDVEVQGHELKEALQHTFVSCSDVMFHASRLVTSQQLASLCVNIKRGLGLTGKDLEMSDDIVTSSKVTRAGVVVSLYHCAKDAWLDFTQELPKKEIMNPFSDIDGSAYDGVVVALAGLCDVAAPPNNRGDAFLPSDWSSRGNAVVASWRMLGCLRDLVSPSGQFPNDFQSEAGVWKWLPSDTQPKAKDSANVAVAASADSLNFKTRTIIPGAVLFTLSFILFCYS